ncbi:MAG: serine hydrolase, partial [Firmicutes bacterium]|nr:serine hydrolase [Bacillota bacterium]
MAAPDLLKPQQPIVLETVSDGLRSSTEADLNLAVKSACLMDADTGTVIYQQEAHKELPPASVTKVMTMLLAMEAEDAGKVKLSDQVTISAWVYVDSDEEGTFVIAKSAADYGWLANATIPGKTWTELTATFT